MATGIEIPKGAARPLAAEPNGMYRVADDRIVESRRWGVGSGVRVA